jgi:glucosamine--fructose-6-phosphate aminotransferase (isomerizing)
VTTIFESEILTQGQILKDRSDAGLRSAARAALLLDSSVTHLVVAARGSSDCVARYLQYFAGQEMGMLVALATPSLYAEPQRINLAGAMVVGISQSGQSPDIVAVLNAARLQHRPSVAITNDEHSPLAREADVVIPLLVGDEKALAATGTMLGSLHAVAQFVTCATDSGGSLPEEAQLSQMVEDMSTWALREMGPLLRGLPFAGLTVVGRGLGLSAAEECALKIREVAGIRAEAYAAPDLLHGPIGAEGSGSTLWLIMSDEVSEAQARDLIERARASGLAVIVSRPEDRATTSADLEFVLPAKCPNWITPFLTIVLGQVMALRLGEDRDRPIDHPLGLKKITLTN